MFPLSDFAHLTTPTPPVFPPSLARAFSSHLARPFSRPLGWHPSPHPRVISPSVTRFCMLRTTQHDTNTEKYNACARTRDTQIIARTAPTPYPLTPPGPPPVPPSAARRVSRDHRALPRQAQWRGSRHDLQARGFTQALNKRRFSLKRPQEPPKFVGHASTHDSPPTDIFTLPAPLGSTITGAPPLFYALLPSASALDTPHLSLLPPARSPT
jgi:hypothetical protein